MRSGEESQRDSWLAAGDPALKDREGGTPMLRAVNRGAEIALMEMMKHPIDMEGFLSS